MKLRAPAVPLVTVDPYFSLWSAADRLTDCPVSHWTGKPNTLNGILTIDGTPYRFMGTGSAAPMEQVNLQIDALSTTYTFQAAGVRLTAAFLSPLLPDRLEVLSRPVSYLELSAVSLDGPRKSSAWITGDRARCPSSLSLSHRSPPCGWAAPLSRFWDAPGTTCGSTGAGFTSASGADPSGWRRRTA